MKSPSEYRSPQSRSCDACLTAAESACCQRCGVWTGRLGHSAEPRLYCAECLPGVKAANRLRGRRALGERLRHRTSVVCPACAKRVPRTFEFFAVCTYGEDGLPMKWDPYCRSCRRAYLRLLYRARPDMRERARARARVQAAKRRARMAVDPAYAEQVRAQRRRWAREEREREREAPSSNGVTGPEIPAGELARAILQLAHWEPGTNGDAEPGVLQDVCGRADVAERTVFRWRTSPGAVVRASLADRVMVNLDLLWWQVWPQGSPGHEEARRAFGDG